MKGEIEYDEDYLTLCLDRAFADQTDYIVPQGITRYDYAHSHGWWLRIRRDNTPFHELFYDGACGSIEEALRQAIKRRHEILSSFPVTIEVVSPQGLSSKPEERVVRIVRKYRKPPGKKPFIAWEARYYDQHHNIGRERFSIRKFGEEQARNLAIAFTKKNHNRVPKMIPVRDQYKKDRVKRINKEDVRVLASIHSAGYGNSKRVNGVRFSKDPFAYEGNRKLAIHKEIERNRALRNSKIAEFVKRNGRIFCEVCGFSFIETYPFLENDIIEVHHRIPLGSLDRETRVELKDLLLICSNCHFAIHQGDVDENLGVAIQHFTCAKGANKRCEPTSPLRGFAAPA